MDVAESRVAGGWLHPKYKTRIHDAAPYSALHGQGRLFSDFSSFIIEANLLMSGDSSSKNFSSLSSSTVEWDWILFTASMK